MNGIVAQLQRCICTSAIGDINCINHCIYWRRTASCAPADIVSRYGFSIHILKLNCGLIEIFDGISGDRIFSAGARISGRTLLINNRIQRTRTIDVAGCHHTILNGIAHPIVRGTHREYIGLRRCKSQKSGWRFRGATDVRKLQCATTENIVISPRSQPHTHPRTRCPAIHNTQILYLQKIHAIEKQNLIRQGPSDLFTVSVDGNFFTRCGWVATVLFEFYRISNRKVRHHFYRNGTRNTTVCNSRGEIAPSCVIGCRRCTTDGVISTQLCKRSTTH